ncbi:MAG: hypothetical protein IPJ04_02585 [Candidatus Eisenbacteria bacterium]|nr:hypothetical protein [Candidatus Eisenbacteria bacterium]
MIRTLRLAMVIAAFATAAMAVSCAQQPSKSAADAAAAAQAAADSAKTAAAVQRASTCSSPTAPCATATVGRRR